MKTLRNLALAGTAAIAVAIAAALSSGAANAAPVQALEIGVPAATESAVTPAFHFGGHHHGFRRLCYVPFHQLAQWYGYWQARMIKRRCFGGYHYGYYGYGYGY